MAVLLGSEPMLRATGDGDAVSNRRRGKTAGGVAGMAMSRWRRQQAC